MNPAVLQILDVNLNRAREGLRVLEDTSRFLWKDQALFKIFRSLRHGLDKITRKAYPQLLASRDSVYDLGRRIPEQKKRDFQGLVAANCRRAEEALRVLEEYGKVLRPGAVQQFKRFRYRLYTAEKKALRKIVK
jgi:thiamine-phosphate pyrophosphorylase